MTTSTSRTWPRPTCVPWTLVQAGRHASSTWATERILEPPGRGRGQGGHGRGRAAETGAASSRRPGRTRRVIGARQGRAWPGYRPNLICPTSSRTHGPSCALLTRADLEATHVQRAAPPAQPPDRPVDPGVPAAHRLPVQGQEEARIAEDCPRYDPACYLCPETSGRPAPARRTTALPSFSTTTLRPFSRTRRRAIRA